MFGLNPSEVTTVIYGAMVFCAIFVLRGDIVHALRRPRHVLYGGAFGKGRLNWTWSRTVLGLFLGPALWMLPLAYGFALIQINLGPALLQTLLPALGLQILLMALAEELFFREAVVKAFSTSTAAIYFASVLAFFIFYLPGGVPAAMIAAGAGMYYLTLRLIGTNILVVALLHGLTTVAFTRVFPPGLTPDGMWSYAIYFLTAAAALSLLVYGVFAQDRRAIQYA